MYRPRSKNFAHKKEPARLAVTYKSCKNVSGIWCYSNISQGKLLMLSVKEKMCLLGKYTASLEWHSYTLALKLWGGKSQYLPLSTVKCGMLKEM